MTYKSVADYLRDNPDLFSIRPGAVNRLPADLVYAPKGVIPQVKSIRIGGRNAGKLAEIEEAMLAPIRDRIERAWRDMMVTGQSALFIGFDEAAGLKLKETLTLKTLTLKPAPKGGYTVIDEYSDDVLFAGTLDDCLDHMKEAMEEAEDERATAEQAAEAKRKAAETQRLLAAEATRIRTEAEQRIAALHVVPAVTPTAQD